MDGVSSIPQLPLKVTFFAHLTLTVWAMQGSWLPISYMYYNTFFLVLLLWSTHSKESAEPVSMAFLLNMASILLDIITIAVYSPHHPSCFHGTFTIVMAIINLMARPVTSVVLFRLTNERGGNYNDFGVPNLAQYFGSAATGGVSRGPYEDIDRPVVAQSVPQNNIDPYSPLHKGPTMMGSSGPVSD